VLQPYAIYFDDGWWCAQGLLKDVHVSSPSRDDAMAQFQEAVAVNGHAPKPPRSVAKRAIKKMLRTFGG
jgi:hypothetical protein